MAVVRHEANDEEIVLGVLGAIERDPAVTQRSVASELGIALGLANAYLKRCVRKGLIKVGEAPARRYAYYLTPQGFAEKTRLTGLYLAHSFSFFRRARMQCSEQFAMAAARGHRRLLLLGDSDLSAIANLVGSEQAVEIVGTIPASSNPRTLKASAKAVGAVDAVMITAIENAPAVHAAACAVFGADAVYAPTLLRISVAQANRPNGANGANGAHGTNGAHARGSHP